MEYIRPFKSGPIEPVAFPGQHLLLAETQIFRLYQIAFIEPVPRSWPLMVNIGAIVAGAVANIFSTTAVLDMGDGELGQFRAQVLDDISVQMNQPQANTRGNTRNVSGRWTLFNNIKDPDGHMTEFFIPGLKRIFLTATNPTGYNLAQSRVIFWGFRYILAGKDGVTELSEGSLPAIKEFTTIKAAEESGYKFTVIPAGGWSR